MSASPEWVARDFKLSEFAVSAEHPDLVQPVPRALEPRITLLATKGLQVVRDAIGRPMRILSGYRSHALNRAAGGSPTSQHVIGEAADFTCDDIDGAFVAIIELVREGRLSDIGQCIRYPDKGFIHMALKSGRFPKPTLCVHAPSRGLSYRIMAPNRAAYLALLGTDPNAPKVA